MISKSQKVSLVSKLAASFDGHSWAEIDLHLREFGFPTVDRWEGARHEYLLSMLAQGTEGALLELARHFELVPDEPVAPVAEEIWTKGFLRVFVSHISANKTLAMELKLRLSKFGIDCFVAHNDIELTAEWLGVIEKALASCDCLIALLTPGFHESRWTDQEVGYALGRGVLSFAISYGVDPYGFLGKFQAIQAGQKPTNVLAVELLTVLQANSKVSERVTSALVHGFCASGSFDDSRILIHRIAAIKEWKPEHLEMLKKAASENDQITKAWGVSAKVKEILQKAGIQVEDIL